MLRHGFLLALVASVSAQGLSGVVSPNPAPLGAPVTLTITEATGTGVVLPSPCPAQQLRSGSPTGPLVPQNVACIAIIWPLGPCQSISDVFVPPAGLPAGTYWFQVDYWDAGFSTFNTEFFAFSYQDATAPSLTAGTAARVGQDLVMTASAPLLGGATYVAAASITTNSGFGIPGAWCALDPDFLFFLSFPSPNPILFSNFQGVLSPSGVAGGITVHIPNLSALVCAPLHVQAAILDPAAIRLTNPLNVQILP